MASLKSGWENRFWVLIILVHHCSYILVWIKKKFSSKFHKAKVKLLGQQQSYTDQGHKLMSTNHNKDTVENLVKQMSSSLTIPEKLHPIVVLPEELVMKARSEWNYILIGQIFCPYAMRPHVVREVCKTSWQLTEEPGVLQIGATPKENKFAFKFSNDRDIRRVRKGMPWSIKGYLCMLKERDTTIHASLIPMTHELFWVHLNELQPEFFGHGIPRRIAQKIGEVLQMDPEDGFPLYRRSIRAKVRVNVKNHLPRAVELNLGMFGTVYVELYYEKLPGRLCNVCRILDHPTHPCEIGNIDEPLDEQQEDLPHPNSPEMEAVNVDGEIHLEAVEAQTLNPNPIAFEQQNLSFSAELLSPAQDPNLGAFLSNNLFTNQAFQHPPPGFPHPPSAFVYTLPNLSHTHQNFQHPPPGFGHPDSVLSKRQRSNYDDQGPFERSGFINQFNTLSQQHLYSNLTFIPPPNFNIAAALHIGQNTPAFGLGPDEHGNKPLPPLLFKLPLPEPKPIGQNSTPTVNNPSDIAESLTTIEKLLHNNLQPELNLLPNSRPTSTLGLSPSEHDSMMQSLFGSSENSQEAIEELRLLDEMSMEEVQALQSNKAQGRFITQMDLTAALKGKAPLASSARPGFLGQCSLNEAEKNPPEVVIFEDLSGRDTLLDLTAASSPAIPSPSCRAATLPIPSPSIPFTVPEGFCIKKTVRRPKKHQPKEAILLPHEMIVSSKPDPATGLDIPLPAEEATNSESSKTPVNTIWPLSNNNLTPTFPSLIRTDIEVVARDSPKKKAKGKAKASGSRTGNQDSAKGPEQKQG